MTSNNASSLSARANIAYDKPAIAGFKFYGYPNRNLAQFVSPQGRDVYVYRADLEEAGHASLSCPVDKVSDATYLVPATMKLPSKEHVALELPFSAKDILMMLDGMNGSLLPGCNYGMYI